MLMRLAVICAIVGLFTLTGCASMTPRLDIDDLARQVRETERAFAKTMADRDHEAFRSFLAEETIFFSGDAPLRGRERVAEAWRSLYEGEEAPFSWEPEVVEVLDSGTLALSSGPVRNAEGEVIAIFNSIWRLEPDGAWRVIFDRGCKACD